MKTIETVGKDIEKALLSGLAELGCKLDDVDVKILEHPGIFRKARVRLTYHGDDETVEKKTAAGVMRNLEARAARASSAPAQNKQGDRKRGNDRADGSARPAPARGQADKPRENVAPERADKERAEGREKPARADNKRPQQPVRDNARQDSARQDNARQDNARQDNAERRKTERLEKRPEQAQKPDTEQKKTKPEGEKAGFRKDFRAELEAAQRGEPARASRPEPQAAQNGRAEGESKAPQPRREQQPKTLPPEVLEAAGERVKTYLGTLTRLMGAESGCEVTAAEDTLSVVLTSGDESLVGARGETLDAIEHLAMLAANAGDGHNNVHVDLDCGGYRARMNDSLIAAASEAADKAVATGKRVEMPAMSSSNRRVVHAALSERADVITRSEGKDPHRFIVIIPKGSKRGEQKGNRDRRPNGNNRRHKSRNFHNGGNKNNSEE